MVFRGTAGTDEPHLVNWGSPTRNYKLTYDFFTKDAVTTNNGIVAHTFAPWIMFHNTLPLNGNKWTYGLQAWGRQGLTLSGTVHEHSRALELIFNFTPEQLLKLKRNVAITAFTNTTSSEAPAYSSRHGTIRFSATANSTKQVLSLSSPNSTRPAKT